jgi:hypothetical protein
MSTLPHSTTPHHPRRRRAAAVLALALAVALAQAAWATDATQHWKQEWFAYEREIQTWCHANAPQQMDTCMQTEMAKHGVSPAFFAQLRQGTMPQAAANTSVSQTNSVTNGRRQPLDVSQSRMVRTNVGAVDVATLQTDGKEERGVVDGIPYQVLPGGSASFGSHDIWASEKYWFVEHKIDPIHDHRIWTLVNLKGLVVMLIRTPTGQQWLSVHISHGKHGCYPGSVDYLRIDSWTPWQVACDKAWENDSARRIIQALSTGTDARTQYTAWPWNTPQNKTIELRGFAVAWRYLQWLSQQPVMTTGR